MPAWVVPAAIAAGGALINAIQARRQRKLNEAYLAGQNSYNEPAAQMARYKKAGLNPALVYTQGNPGNQSQALSAPEVRSGSEAVQSYNQSRLADTQQAVGEARVDQSRAMTAVNRLQADVLSRNPLLNDGAFESMIEALKADAKIKIMRGQWFGKQTQSDVQRFDKDGNAVVDIALSKKGFDEMDAQLKLLEQRFDLGQADQAIKAQVLNSKEFENAMLKVQEDFITNGNWGPAQILEFVKLLLTRVKAR